MRVLAGGVERVDTGSGVIFAHSSARLHRVRHQTVVNQINFGDMCGALKRRHGFILVAKVEVKHRIVGGNFVNLRCAFFGGAGRVRVRLQNRVIHIDSFGSFTSLGIGCGDDYGDVISHIIDLVDSQSRMRCALHRGAVFRMDHPAANRPADFVSYEVSAGVNTADAFHVLGLGNIDFVDFGMGVRRAQKKCVRLVHTVHVVGVIAFACNKTLIFFAADGCANTCSTHGFSPKSRICRKYANLSIYLIIPPRGRGPARQRGRAA